MKYFIFTLFGVCLSLSHIAAQVSLVNGTPYSFDNAATLSDIANVPLIEMPFVDTEALLAEGVARHDRGLTQLRAHPGNAAAKGCPLPF